MERGKGRRKEWKVRKRGEKHEKLKIEVEKRGEKGRKEREWEVRGERDERGKIDMVKKM